MIVRNPTRANAWLLSLPPTLRQMRWVVAIVAFEGILFVTDLSRLVEAGEKCKAEDHNASRLRRGRLVARLDSA